MNTSKTNEDEIVQNYQKLVNMLDEKRLKTTFEEVKQKFTDVSSLDTEISKEMQKLGFFPEMALNVTELHSTERSRLLKIESYLRDLVKMKNINVGQQIISNSLVQLDDEIIRNYNIGQNESVTKANNLENTLEELNEVKESCKRKLEEFQELVRLYRLKQNNGEPVTDEDNQLSDEDLAKMELKYKKIVEKNLMLSHFVTDLITSMNSCDISANEELRNIILDCADIKYYDLIDN
ncbi:hypothetical protein CANINC_000203 [Pichia inconspicua]|uniref:Uncharacterized protein n=1 Tax=Pichia inconspicua TaxID=52247 RepID=A0A4V4NGA9_9ASCO|nr:hypothetical protein CANINC_000203 [[Candida] inconspicua]